MTLDASLDDVLGHRFANASLRSQALTHRSFGTPNNERLEFLGDAVLNFVIAALLYARYERLNEGELSRMRASLVREPALAQVALALKLGEYLHLGDGEFRSGGRDRPSILADALEALIGAVYLDAGFDRARDTIAKLWQPLLDEISASGAVGKDAKTALQEWLQARRLDLPRYDLVATHGAAHSQTFDVACVVEAFGVSAQGTSTSRRAAEQAAAQAALAQLAALQRESHSQSQPQESHPSERRST